MRCDIEKQQVLLLDIPLLRQCYVQHHHQLYLTPHLFAIVAWCQAVGQLRLEYWSTKSRVVWSSPRCCYQHIVYKSQNSPFRCFRTPAFYVPPFRLPSHRTAHYRSNSYFPAKGMASLQRALFNHTFGRNLCALSPFHHTYPVPGSRSFFSWDY